MKKTYIEPSIKVRVITNSVILNASLALGSGNADSSEVLSKELLGIDLDPLENLQKLNSTSTGFFDFGE